jgi:hypothetical protein
MYDELTFDVGGRHQELKEESNERLRLAPVCQDRFFEKNEGTGRIREGELAQQLKSLHTVRTKDERAGVVPDRE